MRSRDYTSMEVDQYSFSSKIVSMLLRLTTLDNLPVLQVNWNISWFLGGSNFVFFSSPSPSINSPQARLLSSVRIAAWGLATKSCRPLWPSFRAVCNSPPPWRVMTPDPSDAGRGLVFPSGPFLSEESSPGVEEAGGRPETDFSGQPLSKLPPPGGLPPSASELSL